MSQQSAFGKAIFGMLLMAAPLLAWSQDGAKLFADKGCVSCHGDNGQGVEGLAPALKGNSWVASTSADEVAKVIKKGRRGKDRRHPNIPGGMPPNPVSDEEAQALVAFLKNQMK